MKSNSGIYIITSPSGGIYVGSTINFEKRWDGHKKDLLKQHHGNSKLQKAWNKYGERNLVFSILLVCKRSDLLFYEQRAIDVLKPRYNICLIAGNSLGVKRSDKTKEKLRVSHRGLKQSLETRRKRAENRRGYKFSEESKAKISASHIGLKHSEEAKAKMRAHTRTDEHRAALSKAHLGNTNRLGAVIPQEMRNRISAKLKGRSRSLEAIMKHRATMAAKRAEMR